MISLASAVLLLAWGLVPDATQQPAKKQINQQEQPSNMDAQPSPSIQERQSAADERAGKQKNNESYADRVLEFFDRWGNTVNALSTLSIAVFTIILWWSTHLLWKSGKKQSEQALRAYLGVTHADFLEHVDGSKTKAEIHIKNTGQTPAMNVVVTATFDFYDVPRREFSHHGEPANRSKATLFPGCDVKMPIFVRYFISNENKKEVIEGKAAFFLHGDIQYRDAFGEDRFTNFRYIADNDQSGTLSWRATAEGNDSN